MSAFFITASGTEIGKTFITELLLRQLHVAGYDCSAIKPLISGFDGSAIEETDTGKLLLAQGLVPDTRAVERTSPWRFTEPISPDIAAEREGRRVELRELIEFCDSKRRGDVTLIEGVGGVMAPINEKHTVLDWIEALEIPALLVVGSYLGSISHALTAADALRRHNVQIAGLIVNQSAAEPVPSIETLTVIQRHLPDIACCLVERKRAGHEFSPPDLIGLLRPHLKSISNGTSADAEYRRR